MPRPKSPYPKEKLHISLPQETAARLRILFHTPNTQTGLIQGALSAFINEAILEKLERVCLASQESSSTTQQQKSDSGSPTTSNGSSLKAPSWTSDRTGG